ncbi:MAG: anti-sigma factor family protein [Candidatus Aminicenantales bacterium]
MRCRRIERWISDSLDGEISEKKRVRVEHHVARCPRCRAFRDQMVIISQESGRLEQPEIPRRAVLEFSEKLASKLREIQAAGQALRPANFRVRWVLVGAGLFAAAVLGLLVIVRNPSPWESESYVFSVEEAVEQIYSEIGNDSELENAFNAMILASLRDMISTSPSGLEMFEEPFLRWEEFTEEDLSLLGSQIEIKKRKMP